MIEVDEFNFKEVICPICGNKTLNNFWICNECGWEYDGIMDDKIYSTANKSTIIKYKKKYEKEKKKPNNKRR